MALFATSVKTTWYEKDVSSKTDLDRDSEFRRKSPKLRRRWKKTGFRSRVATDATDATGATD